MDELLFKSRLFVACFVIAAVLVACGPAGSQMSPSRLVKPRSSPVDCM
jgi:hypothetical protein